MLNRTRWIVVAAAGLTVAAAALSWGKRSKQEAPPRHGPVTIKPPPASSQAGALKLSAALSSSKLLVGGDGRVYLDVDLSAAKLASVARPRVTIALVVDRSMSMDGQRLVDAKLAAQRLVDALQDGDRVTLLSFGTDVTVLAPTLVLRADSRAELRSRINDIRAVGSTNMSEALLRARAELAKTMAQDDVTRIVLLSDGEPKAPGLTEINDFALLADESQGLGMPISTIGVGDSYREDIMRAMAEHSAGQFHHVEDSQGLNSIIDSELASVSTTVAKRTQVVLELAPGVEIDRVFGYPYSSEGSTHVVQIGDLASGQQRKLVVRLRVPATQVGTRAVARIDVSFDDVGSKRSGLVIGTVVDVELSRDVDAVGASLNRAVQAKVEQVESAATIDDAMAQYKAGQIEEAQQLLERRLSASTAIAPSLASPALDASNAGLRKLNEQVRARPAAGSSAGSNMMKGASMDAFQTSR